MGELFVDTLSRVAKVITLPSGVNVRVRAVSDFERTQADREALAASGRFSKSLRDPESTDYQAYILPLRYRGEEYLKASVVAWQRNVIVKEVYRDIAPQYIPFPDNPSEDERREVLEKRVEQDAAISKARQDEVNRRLDTFREKIGSESEESLLSRFDALASSGLANSKYNEEFLWHLLYTASETEDGRKRYFASLDDLRSVPPSVQNALYQAYQEVASVDPFDLQSRSATATSTA